MPLGDLAKAAYGPDGKRRKRRRKRIRKEGHEEIDRAIAEERSRLARLWAEVSITEDAAAALVADPLTVAAAVKKVYANVALATQKALTAGLGIGGDIALTDLSIATLSFNLTNPIAINWAANEAGSLIVETSANQVTTIRSIISEALTSGKGVREVAPAIRDSIGLHSRYAKAVENFRAREFTNLIKQHPRTPLDVLQRRANEKASKYADRLRRSRAKTIARTELQRAANEGQRQAWQQAVDTGKLEVTGAEREYIATLGGHAICDDQDGIRIPWNGEFPVAGDPPIHPNCGCTFALRGATVKA